MPIVTETEVDGFRTCGRPRHEFPDDCPGYDSEPCRVVRQYVAFSYVDGGADPAQVGMDTSMTERTAEHIRPADDDWACRHCGEPANFTLEPRPSYRRVTEQDPDELVRRARDQADATGRSADALEKLVAQGDQSAEIAQLRALVERLMDRDDADEKVDA